MTDINTIEKYDTLFQSAAEFSFRVGLCHRDEVKGFTDDKIHEFCEKHNVNLPPALWSHTRHFGQKARVRDTDYNCTYSVADYDYALHQARLREEWHEMKTVKELLNAKNFKVNYDDDYPIDNDGLYTPDIKSIMNIDDAFIYHYDPFAREFKFVDGTKENPVIFYLTRYYTLTSLFSSFTNRFRDILFMYIVNYAPQDFAQMAMVDNKQIVVSTPPIIDYANGYEWIKTYQDMFKQQNLDRGKLKRLRDIFYFKNDELETKENKILSFTEFENEFISFLNENDFK